MRVPDPLAFVADGLARRGALVERDGERALALSPPECAREYSIAEECRLGLAVTEPGVTACGFGSTLLDRLIGDARASVPCAYLRWDADPPRASHAVSMANRFAVRNGLCEVLDASVFDAVYVFVAVGYLAEADDRHEGLIHLAVDPRAGAEPEAQPETWVDFTAPPAGMRNAPADRAAVTQAARWIARRAEIHARDALAIISEGVGRRHARDHARLVEYYGALIAEAESPRRRVDAAAIEAKIAHLMLERDKRIRDLDVRFGVRASLSPAAICTVSMPTARVTVRIRRRKASRDITMQLPAGGRALDRPACESCLSIAPRPAVCDDNLHLLCETCAPTSQGRLSCGACARREPT